MRIATTSTRPTAWSSRHYTWSWPCEGCVALWFNHQWYSAYTLTTIENIFDSTYFCVWLTGWSSGNWMTSSHTEWIKIHSWLCLYINDVTKWITSPVFQWIRNQKYILYYIRLQSTLYSDSFRKVMVFNVTFNNISSIWWRNRRKSPHWQTLSIKLYRVHLATTGIRTHNVRRDRLWLQTSL